MGHIGRIILKETRKRDPKLGGSRSDDQQGPLYSYRGTVLKQYSIFAPILSTEQKKETMEELRTYSSSALDAILFTVGRKTSQWRRRGESRRFRARLGVISSVQQLLSRLSDEVYIDKLSVILDSVYSLSYGFVMINAHTETHRKTRHPIIWAHRMEILSILCDEKHRVRFVHYENIGSVIFRHWEKLWDMEKCTPPYVDLRDD